MLDSDLTSGWSEILSSVSAVEIGMSMRTHPEESITVHFVRCLSGNTYAICGTKTRIV